MSSVLGIIAFVLLVACRGTILLPPVEEAKTSNGPITPISKGPSGSTGPSNMVAPGTPTGPSSTSTGPSLSNGGGSSPLPPLGCQADCTNKSCGDDGCNGTCGGCPPTQLCSATFACQTPSDTSDIVVDANSQRTVISGDIYGVGAATAGDLAYASLNRCGGDSTGTYNWKVDGFNTGTDWWCANYGGLCGVSGTSYSKGYQQFIANNTAHQIDSLMTIPITGWVAADASYNDMCCGNYDSGTGSCTAYSYDPVPQSVVNCCISVGSVGSTLVDGNSAVLDTTDMQAWVTDMVTTFGSAADGGVKYYQLDNEPDNWRYLRPDIYPMLYPPGTACQSATTPMAVLGNITMVQDFINRTLAYAGAVKSVDPTASVLFMSTEGPSDLVSLDSIECGELDGFSNTKPLVATILQQAKTIEANTHIRQLDCVDFHYPNAASDFWTSGQTESSIQGWINANYPGTGTCVSEYSWPSDLPSEADFLGTFGRFGVRLAANWGGYNGNTGALLIYKNYDGKGSHLGNYSVGAASPIAGVHVYAAVDSPTSPTTLWVILVNTSGSVQNNLSLKLNNFAAGASSAVYTVTSPTAAPVAKPNLAITSNSLTLAQLAAGAVTLLVIGQ